MKSFQSSNVNKEVEHGRAIARGMEEIRVHNEKSIAKAARRRQTMLENAAEKALFKS